MVPIRLYNTKSRTIEEFKPIKDGHVGLYSCGPTVYNYVHIGNLRSYVFSDIIRRLFEHHSYDVRQIINITDIGHLVTDGDDGEDKMTNALKREGKPLTLEAMREVADFYFEKFKENLDALNIKHASVFPFASDNIPEDISLVTTLLEKGYAYGTSDGIYFDTSKFSHYGELARLDLSGQETGARVEANTEKRNGADFALWKFNKELGYDAPFGKGFPGWHIECSAMSMKYLGNHFDIHTGGIDHIPVHHTNEIAQSECATNETFVNYWLHNNFVHDTTGKMSKSKGDFLTLATLIEKGYDPLAYRYFLLTVHYRKEVTFSYEALDGASSAYQRIIEWCKEHRTDKGTIHSAYMQKFEDFMHDDLSTPSCIALIFELIKDENLSFNDRYRTLIAFDEVLGLSLALQEEEHIEVPLEVQTLLEKRQAAREAKDFESSDRLRDEISGFGFVVKDTQNGQEITRK